MGGPVWPGRVRRECANPEDSADRITLAELCGKTGDAARRGRGHIDGGFVGLDFDDVLIGLDRIAGLDEELNDGCLGGGFAKLRPDGGNLRHGHRASKWRAGAAVQRGKGAVGGCELGACAAGTNAVAQAVAAVKGTTIIGGGD